jgi:hypothetical protein
MGLVTNATTSKRLLQPYPVTGGRLLCTADRLYALAHKRARRSQVWSCLTGRSRGLFALKQVRANCTILTETSGGTRRVPLRQIRGSRGRSRYFDRDFSPLYDQTRRRWLSIARARQQGKGLPPVALVEVGDIYFVKDGHHRISVARALGQREIEARVTVWQVTGPLPWETPARASSPELIGRLLGIGRAYEKRGHFRRARSAAGSVRGG